MSGIEAAVLPLSLLCNAMQIVTFTREVVHFVKDIREHHSPDPKLRRYAQLATEMYDSMQASMQTSPSTELAAEQKELVDIGKDHKERLDELAEKLDKLSVSKGKRKIHGFCESVSKGIQAAWNKDEIQKLEDDVSRHEQLLQTKLLRTICSTVRLRTIKDSEAFAQLDQKLQQFINRLLEGCNTMEQLVPRESEMTRQHVTQQHDDTRQHVTEAVHSSENALKITIQEGDAKRRKQEKEASKDQTSKEERDRLLASLRFPTMNQRMNDIVDKHSSTFEWIFKTSSSSTGSMLSTPEESATGSTGTYYPEQDRLQQQRRVAAGGFITWLRSDDKIFWVAGSPGSGKSTLMRFLFEDNVKTLEHLGVWRPRVRILSNYFWKPGEPLQRSVKGMLCSLALQVLEHEPHLADHLLGAMPRASRKVFLPDWSIRELKEVLMKLFRESSSAFCMALDGLDEIDEAPTAPGPPVTELLRDIRNLDNVKVCASSRPEAQFETYFHPFPMLRLQELNELDIYLFAADLLAGTVQARELVDSDPPFSGSTWHSFAAKIAYSSQGIFLWATIVTAQLERGLRQGDSLETLYQRLNSMPRRLHDLFRDMWKRLGDDTRIYQQEAARYLKHIVTWQMRYPDSGYTMPFSNAHLSFGVFAIATSDSILSEFVERNGVITRQELLDRCRKTAHRVTVCCAGLICIKRLAYRPVPLRGEDVEDSSQLSYYVCQTAEFLHRTVYDFLTDTEDGRQMLQGCTSSSMQVASNCIKACMIIGRFCGFYNFPTELQGSSIRSSCVSQVTRLIDEALEDENTKESHLSLLQQWQLKGFFKDSTHWQHLDPQFTSPDLDPLRLELLEMTLTFTVRSLQRMQTKIAEMSIPYFMATVPLVVRKLTAMPFGFFGYTKFDTLSVPAAATELCNSMIRRLQQIASSASELSNTGVTADCGTCSEDLVESLLALLVAWFAGTWLGNFPLKEITPHLLNKICLSLSSSSAIAAVGNRTFLFECSLNPDSGLGLKLYHRKRPGRQIGFIVACNNMAMLRYLRGSIENKDDLPEERQWEEQKSFLKALFCQMGVDVELDPADKEWLSSALLELLTFPSGSRDSLSGLRKKVDDCMEAYLKGWKGSMRDFNSSQMTQRLEESGHPCHPWM